MIPAPSARILIVDDDELTANRVAAILVELGHVPVVATDWAEALSRFGEDTDLVLLDMVMPKVDGLKLAPLLRERSRSYVPVVFLTGRDSDADRERALHAGADDFIAKPVRAIELKVRVTAMLRIRALTKSLHRGAHVDPLTNIGNRRAFDDALARRCDESRRYQRPFSLIMLDIDHFKAINDTFGHTVGDDVLVLLSGVLRDGVRCADQVFRYGGEEFAVIAPETGYEGAMILAERLRVGFRVASRTCAAGRRTLSAGVASTEGIELVEPRQMLKHADDALYHAKHAGRDCVIAQPARITA